MIDSYWQWMTALVLGLAVLLIPILGWRLYLRTRPTPEPDVATEAASEAHCTPMKRYDIDLEADLIVDAREQEEYERLYGRLRWHVDVALQRGKGQLL